MIRNIKNFSGKRRRTGGCGSRAGLFRPPQAAPPVNAKRMPGGGFGTLRGGSTGRIRLSAEIAKVLDEQQERENGRPAHWKMRLWSFTVRSTYAVKRLFDIILASLAMIVLSPLFVVIALLIKLTSPGPVFFTQLRVGKYGRQFRFYKFRSMYIDAEKRKKELLEHNQSGDGVIFKMKDDPRITPVGKILRRTSLDELPQFLNVLFNDMSLVGPRPPLPSEVQMYTLEERKRLNVKPGLTCLWQISGRSDVPFKQQVALDKEYIQSWSLMRDLWILLRTIPAILSGRGAY